MTILDTAIVGGGQAGLGVSYFLQQNGNKHIVFEQGGSANHGYQPAGTRFN